MKTQRNLTRERVEELLTIDFKTPPLELAIKQVSGNGKRVMAVFEDPNCGYCKRLRADLVKLDDVTIYVPDGFPRRGFRVQGAQGAVRRRQGARVERPAAEQPRARQRRHLRRRWRRCAISRRSSASRAPRCCSSRTANGCGYAPPSASTGCWPRTRRAGERGAGTRWIRRRAGGTAGRAWQALWPQQPHPHRLLREAGQPAGFVARSPEQVGRAAPVIAAPRSWLTTTCRNGVPSSGRVESMNSSAPGGTCAGSVATERIGVSATPRAPGGPSSPPGNSRKNT